MTCEAVHEEHGACELEQGHKGAHRRGYSAWDNESDAARPRLKLRLVVVEYEGSDPDGFAAALLAGLAQKGSSRS